MEKGELPKRVKNLLKEIHNIIGEERFIVYGGAAIDILINKRSKINDLDIAIKGISDSRINLCREKIKNAGFKITEPYKEYFIYLNEKVILIYANNRKLNIDVGFLEKPELIGQFNIETLYLRYPQFDYVDRFNALNSLKNKKILLVRRKKENPYILLRRFLHLCSKYDLSLTKKIHKKILLDIAQNIKKWNLTNISSKQAHTACISSILKDFLNAKNKKRFIKEILELKIIELILPEFNIPSRQEKDRFFNCLINSKSKLDIVKTIMQNVKQTKRKEFKIRIKRLGTRKGDRQDVQCSKYFSN